MPSEAYASELGQIELPPNLQQVFVGTILHQKQLAIGRQEYAELPIIFQQSVGQL